MPFEKGHKYYGHEKKTTPSPAKMRVEEVKQTFLRMGVNPIELLCKIAKSKSKKPVPEHKLKALAELCRYYAPRLSTQAIIGRIDGNLQITEAVRQILVSADADTIRALEAVSLKLSAMDRESRRSPVIDLSPALPAPAEVIDVAPALPEPSTPEPAEDESEGE